VREEGQWKETEGGKKEAEEIGEDSERGNGGRKRMQNSGTGKAIEGWGG
jgi:hypothetical protein